MIDYREAERIALAAINLWTFNPYADDGKIKVDFAIIAARNSIRAAFSAAKAEAGVAERHTRRT